MPLPVVIEPDVWMRQVFSAKAVNTGGVIRRKISDVDRIVGRDVFLSEIDRRGFRAVENCGQILIFCNRAPVRVLV